MQLALALKPFRSVFSFSFQVMTKREKELRGVNTVFLQSLTNTKAKEKE